MKKKIYLYAILTCLLDQLVKIIMDNLLVLNHNYLIINNFFYLTKVYNDGASWSIFSGQRLFLIIIGIIMFWVINSIIKTFKLNKRNLIAFSLLIGGLLGNLFDRIIRGHVIDFFDFKIFLYDFPIFNIADICIVCGVILLIISIIKGDDKNDSYSK